MHIFYRRNNNLKFIRCRPQNGAQICFRCQFIPYDKDNAKTMFCFCKNNEDLLITICHLWYQVLQWVLKKMKEFSLFVIFD